MPVVYIDLLFFMNFLMNSVTLYCTSLFLKRPVSLLKMAFAAAILALYSAIMFFPNLGFLYSVLFKAIILTVAVQIAFPAKALITVLKNTVLFFTVNAIFGGVMFALIFATDFGTRVGATVSNGEIYLNIRASSIILSTIPAYSAAFVISFIRKQSITRSMNLADLEIAFNGRKIKIKAFSDTGCGLYEPIERKPVIIISAGAAKKLLPHKFFRILTDDSVCEDSEFSHLMRIIPYSTIGQSFGILKGFCPHKLVINNTEINSCVVAIVKHSLCDNSQYDSIFNPDILINKNTDTSSNLEQTPTSTFSAERI